MVVHGRPDNAIVCFFLCFQFYLLSSLLANIYCIPLQSPANMVKDLKTNATTLDTWLKDIEIKHPLVRMVDHSALVHLCILRLINRHTLK